MAGYSGTPLPRKLGIRPGHRALIVRAPSYVLAELRTAAGPGTRLDARRGKVDFALVFSTRAPHLVHELGAIERRLAPDGMVWLCWPKRASGVDTDLSEGAVRRAGLDAGLVDVKVCAVSETWSGLKFVRRRRDRR
jgi:hypothetical protein